MVPGLIFSVAPDWLDETFRKNYAVLLILFSSVCLKFKVYEALGSFEIVVVLLSTHFLVTQFEKRRLILKSFLFSNSLKKPPSSLGIVFLVNS